MLIFLYPLASEFQVLSMVYAVPKAYKVCLFSSIAMTSLFFFHNSIENHLSVTKKIYIVLIKSKGLLWWRSGWESPCQCRGHGFEPWSGKIPHAAEQVGPWATTTEPARLEPVLRNGRGRDGERPVHHDEEWPPLAAAGESPRTEAKNQHSQKWINKLVN